MVRFDVSVVVIRSLIKLLMKVLIVASLASSLIKFRLPLIEALIKRGVDVHAAAPDFSSSPSSSLVLTELGVTLHSIRIQRSGLNPVSDLLSIYSIWSVARRISPKIVFGYTVKPVIYGTIAAFLAGVPYRYALITGLGYAFTGDAGGLRYIVKATQMFLYKISLMLATKVFFQNPDDEALFTDLKLKPELTPSIVFNGSGVDLNEFNTVPIPVSPITFLLIARLLGDKGVREYVSAAREIRSANANIRFLLVGWIDENPDSISEGELQRWIDDGFIEYLGRLRDVRGAISACTIYVLPSYREGTPRSVLEAMAMGRPIITTDAPGCRETVIDGENGFLVPVKSVDGLVSAMNRFIANPGIIPDMGRCSRSMAELKYNAVHVSALMLHEMGI